MTAIFLFRDHNDLVVHFPAPRMAIRLGGLVIPLRIVDLTIFTCMYILTLISDAAVKFLGLLAQLFAAVVLVSENTSPDVYIPLGTAVFVFGLMEGGMDIWRNW